jgi:hypothetical protein
MRYFDGDFFTRFLGLLHSANDFADRCKRLANDHGLVRDGFPKK